MSTNIQIKKTKPELIYSDLSYLIIGALFDVHNQLGHGFSEKVYQKALAVAFKNAGLKFKEQVYAPLLYLKQNVGINYFDFLIEDKIVVEIKKGNRFSKSHIDQVYQYLKAKNIKLGILAYFSPNKLHFKRIVNLDPYIRKNP